MNKNIVQCEKCQTKLNLNKIPIEAKYIGEIRIQFFRCPSCHEKYLIDVTDKATREKQIEYARLGTYQKQLMESVNKDNLEAIEQLTLKNNDKMAALLQEIKDTKAELKEKYGPEL
jgi:C4-type Zn-finger protein